MADINFDTCLLPISAEAPCGEAMDYDLDFLELETAARRRPAQQDGDRPRPEEAPDWTEVLRMAMAVAGQSMDLRVGVILARTAMAMEGFAGLNKGLVLLAGYMEGHWEQVHPNPDPGDDDTVRVNAVANLCDPEELLHEIRRVPVAQSRRLGAFAFSGRVGARRDAEDAGDEADPAEIASAFRDTSALELVATRDALSHCLGALTRIAGIMQQRVGIAEAARLDALTGLLGKILGWVEEHCPPAPVEVPVPEGAEPPVHAAGTIRNRADIVATLNLICRWYQANEPGSPVPALLERASRLVSQDFATLLAELAPAGLDQFRFLAGLQAGGRKAGDD